MAKNTFADLDTTSANNTDLLGNNVTGNADANTIDTIVQAFAAMTARFYGDIGGLGTVGGSANAITLTSLSTYQALESGLVLTVKASAANTGATTLNLDGLGAKAVRRRGDSALSAGDIAANGLYVVLYDAAYNSSAGAWVLLNPELPSNAARLDTEDQTVSGGARVTIKDLGNLSGASITPDPGDRPIQKITNNGAGSILPGSNEGQYTLQVINATGAGTITTTGWTLKGDAFDNGATSKFVCSCLVTSQVKLMTVLKVA